MPQEPVYISPEQAVQLLAQALAASPETETVALGEASGRILARDLYAPLDQPPFPRSPLDGYAVRALDTTGASRERPVALRVVGTLHAGSAPSLSIAPGEAARIMTGAPIPAEADCVIRQEDTDYGADTVQIHVAHRPFQNYCRRGEDIQKGSLLLQRGEALSFSKIGVLAAMGQARISVFRRPRVGVLTTGDELTDVAAPLAPGKIYNSNQYALEARLRELGAEAVVSPPCPDRADMLAKAVGDAADRVDFLITTGGVSVGERDCMPAVRELLGGEPIFKGIRVKPGAPAMAFRHRGKVVLCLSGNPFAAVATFELLAHPLLPLLQGARVCSLSLPRAAAVLQTAFPKPSPGRRFIRAYYENQRVFLPQEGGDPHSSGVLASMTACNCMIDIPAGSGPLPAGRMVEVVLL